MQQLRESLLSVTKISKDDTRLLLSDILDNIPKLDYKITKTGNKNLITFNSAIVGFDKDEEREKNPLIDGDLYDCDLFFQHSSIVNIPKCYLNLSNLTIKNDDHVAGFYYGDLDNIKILSQSNVYCVRNSVINEVYIKIGGMFSFSAWGVRKYSIRDLRVDSKIIKIEQWMPSMISDVVFSCNKFEVLDSYRPWGALVQKMKSVKTKEQFKTKTGTIKQNMLQEIAEGCLDVEFKNFPNEVMFRDGNKRYKFTKQSDGDYTWEYIA